MNNKLSGLFAVAALILVSAYGCAPVISEGLRDQAIRDVVPEEVRRNPNEYRGEVVIWAGSIIETKNLREGTLIEVIQKPKDYQGRPKDVDDSGGRFLALYEGFLDPAVYEKGREVTVAGEIRDLRQRSLGETSYGYPVVAVREIHLWPEETMERAYYAPPPYWHYSPWWYRYPYHPFWW